MKSKTPSARPDGELRQSQLLTTFGPGAMVDLPEHSVVISGLSFWKGDRQLIFEERLRAKVADLLGVPELQLSTPPQAQDRRNALPVGIDALIFPTWFVAQVEETYEANGKTYRTRPLLTWEGVKGGRGFNGQQVAMVPVRFVQACVHGHLSDLDWHRFVQHQGRCRGQLWLDEGGSGNDFEEIFVRCEACGARRPLAQAKVPDSPVLGPCQGDRPWLGDRDPEGCHHIAINAQGETQVTDKPEYNRLLVRSASNAYFSQVLSVISIPDPNAQLNEALNPFYDGDLEDEESEEDLAKTLRKSKYKALAEFDVPVIWSAIRQRQSGQSAVSKSIKALELDALMNCSEEMGNIAPKTEIVFDGRTRPIATIADRWRPWIERVVLVHRLREVSAQVGFTRFEAVMQNTEGELDDLAIAVRRAALAAEPSWVPAIAHKGEGVFIALARDKIEAWLAQPAVQQRGQHLAQSFQQWRDRRGIRSDAPKFPGLPYVMLHSLSHLLITAVSLDCGYAASAIRERIYAYETGYGILLHTGSAGSEGTLGGLVAVGRQIERHLDRALSLGRLCSNDPVCAQHQPTDPREDRFLHGAACHGCLLIAETSCERRNELLDRALVVETVAGLDAAFFRDLDRPGS